MIVTSTSERGGFLGSAVKQNKTDNEKLRLKCEFTLSLDNESNDEILVEDIQISDEIVPFSKVYIIWPRKARGKGRKWASKNLN